MVGTTVNAVVLQRGLRGAGSGSRCGEADPEQYHAERKNPKWPARDPVARKRGNAFKSFEKNPKMVRILGHLLFRRLRKLRLRCVGVGSALKKVN